MSNTKLERITEMEKQLAALKAEVEADSKVGEWQPRGGEYTTWACGEISEAYSKREHRLFGTEYPTEEQAIKARDAMRTHNRLLAYVAEFDDGWEADWSDESQSKCCIYFNGTSGKYEVDVWWSNKYTGAVHMSAECAKGLVEKLNKGIVKL